MVEHDLAKVGVASSSLVSRSMKIKCRNRCGIFVLVCPGGGIGRHAGLKILWPLKAVRVQLPSRVQSLMSDRQAFFIGQLRQNGLNFENLVGLLVVND